MECKIRPALDDDAAAISAVILRALRETNAKDYTDEIIGRVERSFSPGAVRKLIEKRTVFVAIIGSRLVGTASLDGSVVRTVFVAPDVQAQGIGKLLMAQIERTARERNIPALTVPSSVTAETFYASLGFATVIMVTNARSSWSDCSMTRAKSGPRHQDRDARHFARSRAPK